MGNELYIEKLLCNDAAKIVVDEEFKNDLKNRIMFGGKCNNITEMPKHKSRFKQSRYFKIASGFVLCVVVSGTIFKTIDVPNKNMLTKSEGNTEVIMPIATSEIATIDNSKKATALLPKDKAKEQPKDSTVKSNVKTKQTNVDNKTAVNNADKPLVATVDKKDANIVKNSGKGNTTNTDTDTEINNSLSVKDGKNSSASTGVKGPIDVPKMETVKEDAGKILKTYDSRYSVDEKVLVTVKDGGIYIKDIETLKEKKLIAYNDKTHIVDKPNFTPDNGIIYYKSEKVTLENGATSEKNGAIYLADKNGKDSSKIVDGKNPMISKDGKNLVYEAEGKIYILTLATNAKRLVDIGKYPAWADNGNSISYVKEEKETQNYDGSTKDKDVYIEKSFSSLWVFDLVSQNTLSLTNKEVNMDNNSIQSWAEAVRNGSVTSNFDVTSKYSYFESIWCSNNKEIYVIRKNNDAQVFELIKFKLDN